MVFKTTIDELGKTKISLNNIFSGLFNGDILKDIFTEKSILSDKDIDCLKAYNVELDRIIGYKVKDGKIEPLRVSAQTAYNHTMVDASKEAQNLAEKYDGLKVDLDQIPKSSKAAELGLKALRIAGNMLAMWAVSKVLEVTAEKINELANASEIAEEKATSFANSVSNAVSDMSSNFSTLSSLNEEYQNLSEGVNKLGKNVSLSTSEYDRYKEVVQQISSIMPNMTTYFNDQGEKIAFVKGELSDLNDEYAEYIQKQATEFLVNGDGDGNTFQDALDNFGNNSKMGFWETAKNTIKNMFGSYDVDDLPVDTMISTLENLQNKSREEMIAYLNDIDLGANGEYLQTVNNRTKAIAQEILDTSTGEIRTMTDEEFNTFQESIANNIESLQNSNEVDMSAITSGLLQTAYSKDAFWAVGEDIRNDITTILSSIDAETWKTLGITEQSDVENFVGQLITAISSNKNGVADAWNGLFEPELEDLSVNEYIAKVEGFINTIANALGLDEDGKKQFMISLGFNFDTDQTMINGLKERFDDTGDKWVDTLNKADLELAASDEFEQALAEQKNKLHGAALSAEDYAEALRHVKAEQAASSDETTDLLGISETVNQLNTQLKPAMDSLASAYQSIFTSDGFTLDGVGVDMLSSIQTEIKELSGLGIDIDTSSFEEFANVLSDVSSSEEDVQQQFDRLATEIVRATGSTEVSAENFTVLSKALKEMGLTNTDEVLNQIVEAQNAYKEVAEELGYTLEEVTTATYEETTQMLIQAQAAGLDTSALFKLAVAQGTITDGNISTESNVDALIAEAEAAGLDLSVLTALNAVKNGDIKDTGAAQAIVENARKQISASMSEFQLDFDFSPATKSASKAGKDAGEEYKEALKDELSDLDDVLNYITDIIGDQIDLLEEQKDAAVDALEAEKEKAEEALEAQKELTQAKIDGLQDEIDAIKEAREQRQAEIDLQKKQYELERMQNQKTNLIYKDGQMVYETDTESIRDARESVEEAKESIKILQIEKEISGLEDIIDSLDKQIETSNEYYDKLIEQCETYWDTQIKALEEYQDRWSQLGKLEEQAKIQVALKEIGIETEDVLNMSSETFEQFKQQYLGLLTEIHSGDDAMVESLKAVASSADFSLLDEKLLVTKDNIAQLGTSASTTSESIKTTASSLEDITTKSDAVSTNVASINTAIDSLSDSSKLDSIKTSFNNLLEVINQISDALGMAGEEANGLGLVGAIQQLSQTQLSTELLSQFTELESAINSVTTAIGGGGASSTPTGVEAYIGGWENKNKSSGNSGGLSQALEEQVETAKTLLPEEITLFSGDEESLLSAVNAITDAIGTSKSEIGSGGKDENTLIGALQGQYEKTQEILPKEKTLFDELLTSIQSCVSALAEMASAMEGISTVNSNRTVSVGIGHAEGTVGHAFANGTGKYKGLSHDEKLAVRSEYGQPELTVYPNGKVELTTEPTASSLPKNTVIFNEDQTKKALNNGGLLLGGSFKDGTVQNTDGSFTISNGAVLTPIGEGNPVYDFIKKIESNQEKLNDFMVTPMHNIQDNLNNMVKNISNASTNTVNNQPTLSINGGINVTCPGVTSQEVMKQVGDSLRKEFSGMALEALQEASITR